MDIEADISLIIFSINLQLTNLIFTSLKQAHNNIGCWDLFTSIIGNHPCDGCEIKLKVSSIVAQKRTQLKHSNTIWGKPTRLSPAYKDPTRARSVLQSLLRT